MYFDLGFWKWSKICEAAVASWTTMMDDRGGENWSPSFASLRPFLANASWLMAKSQPTTWLLADIWMSYILFLSWNNDLFLLNNKPEWSSVRYLHCLNFFLVIKPKAYFYPFCFEIKQSDFVVRCLDPEWIQQSPLLFVLSGHSLFWLGFNWAGGWKMGFGGERMASKQLFPRGEETCKMSHCCYSLRLVLRQEWSQGSLSSTSSI